MNINLKIFFFTFKARPTVLNSQDILCLIPQIWFQPCFKMNEINICDVCIGKNHNFFLIFSSDCDRCIRQVFIWRFDIHLDKIWSDDQCFFLSCVDMEKQKSFWLDNGQWYRVHCEECLNEWCCLYWCQRGWVSHRPLAWMQRY